MLLDGAIFDSDLWESEVENAIYIFFYHITFILYDQSNTRRIEFQS